MKRMVWIAVALGLTVVTTTPTLAQLTSSTDLGDGTITRSQGGTPGSWVRAAIGRHNTFIDLRVNAVRGGGQAGFLSSSSGTGTSSSGSLSGSLGSLGSLLDLAGGLGGLGGLGSLTGTSGTGSSGSTTGQDFTLADLLAMAEGVQQPRSDAATTADPKSTQFQQQSTTRVGGAAINRLSKPEDRGQETTDEPEFKIRWADAMLTSIFSALALGLQSTAFIQALEDALRPIIYPPAATDSGTDGSGGSGSGADGGGSSGGGGTGGGIEEIPSDGGGGGGSSSL